MIEAQQAQIAAARDSTDTACRSLLEIEGLELPLLDGPTAADAAE